MRWIGSLIAILLFFALCVEAKVYLVAVGISDYPGTENDLRLPADDANDIARLYRDNATVTYKTLLNSDATKQNILSSMRKLYGEASQNDIVVFYFSGHGYPNGFCAHDGNLTYGEMRKAMASSPCKNKMIFADACYSGGLRSNRKQRKHNAVSTAKKANIMLFLASRDDELSIERRNMKNGMFTAFLLKGLSGAADKDKDRIITAFEIFDYVHGSVVKATHQKQHPVMWGKFENYMPVMVWK